MNRVFYSKNLGKSVLFLLIIQILIIAQNKPELVSSKEPNLVSATDLYSKAFEFEQKKDYLHAVMYLWAYIQHEPLVYRNNVNGFKDYLDRHMSELTGLIEIDLKLARKVRPELERCRRYPCEGLAESGATFMRFLDLIELPPNIAQVCDLDYYKGNCVLLRIGQYARPELIGLKNDSITSVRVGSAVQLTLCAHSGLTNPCITFTENDPDLRNNYIDSQSTWNNNASSAKVSRR